MTPGQIAFKYWEANMERRFIPVPWEDLPAHQKKKWEDLAEAAALRYVEIHDMHG